MDAALVVEIENDLLVNVVNVPLSVFLACVNIFFLHFLHP